MIIMATKLKKFEFKSRSGGSHDWAKYFDGSVWQLKEGEDFTCSVNTFVTLARTRAGKYHKTLQVNKTDDGVVLQAADMTPEQVEEYEAKVAARKAEKESESEE